MTAVSLRCAATIWLNLLPAHDGRSDKAGLGYLPAGGQFLFHLLSRLYERTSIKQVSSMTGNRVACLRYSAGSKVDRSRARL
jgi:hypothetical protein